MPKSTTKSTNTAARRHEQYPRFQRAAAAAAATVGAATRPTPGRSGPTPNGSSRVPWSDLIRRESRLDGALPSSLTEFRDWRRSNLVLVLDEALRIAHLPNGTDNVSPPADVGQSCRLCPPSATTMTGITAQGVNGAHSTGTAMVADLAAVTSSTMNDETEFQHFENDNDTSTSSAADGSGRS